MLAQWKKQNETKNKVSFKYGGEATTPSDTPVWHLQGTPKPLKGKDLYVIDFFLFVSFFHSLLQLLGFCSRGGLRPLSLPEPGFH